MTPQERRLKKGLLWIGKEPPAPQFPFKKFLLAGLLVMTVLSGFGWHFIMTDSGHQTTHAETP